MLPRQCGCLQRSIRRLQLLSSAWSAASERQLSCRLPWPGRQTAKQRRTVTTARPFDHDADGTRAAGGKPTKSDRRKQGRVAVELPRPRRRGTKPTPAADAEHDSLELDEQPAAEPDWRAQKQALRTKLAGERWLPNKRLSPDAIEGIRLMHGQFPDKFSTPVLADQFAVSPEAIRRILKSKWRPNEAEQTDRQRRWENRGRSVWARWAEQGKKAPKKWRDMGVDLAEPDDDHSAPYPAPAPDTSPSRKAPRPRHRPFGDRGVGVIVHDAVAERDPALPGV